MDAPTCQKCGSPRLSSWYNRKSETAFARCLDCGATRALSADEYGRAVLAEHHAGTADPLGNFAARVGLVGGAGR